MRRALRIGVSGAFDGKKRGSCVHCLGSAPAKGMPSRDCRRHERNPVIRLLKQVVAFVIIGLSAAAVLYLTGMASEQKPGGNRRAARFCR